MKILLLFLAFAAFAAAAPRRTDVAAPVTETPAAITITKSIRIIRVEILSDAIQGAHVTIFREQLQSLADGTILSCAPLAAITRVADAAATDKVGSITLNDWLDAAGLFAAKWAAEDAAQPKLVPPKPPTT